MSGMESAVGGDAADSPGSVYVPDQNEAAVLSDSSGGGVPVLSSAMDAAAAFDAETGGLAYTYGTTEANAALDSIPAPIGSINTYLNEPAGWDGKTALLFHFDNNSQDAVTRTTYGAGIYSATQTKFGYGKSLISTNAAATDVFGVAAPLLTFKSLYVGNAWTIEVWLYSSIELSTSTGILYIYNNEVPSASGGFFAVGWITGGLLCDPLTAVASPTIGINGWHHCVWQSDGAKVLFFVDGAPTTISAAGGGAIPSLAFYGSVNYGPDVIYDTLTTTPRTIYFQDWRMSIGALYPATGFAAPIATFFSGWNTRDLPVQGQVADLSEFGVLIDAEAATGPASVAIAGNATATEAAIGDSGVNLQSEVTIGTDLAGGTAAVAAIGAETATVADAPVVLMAFAAADMEAVLSSDTNDAATSAGTNDQAEIVSALDGLIGLPTYPVVETEGAVATDSPAGGNATAVAEIETGAGVDAPGSTNSTGAAEAEAATATDTLGGGNVTATAITEAAAATDVLTAAAVFVRAQAEPAGAADVAIAAAEFITAISEAVSGSDTAAVVAALVSAIAEATTCTDGASGINSQAVPVTEAGAASELSVAAALFVSTVAEMLMALDTADAASLGAVTSVLETAGAVDASGALAVFAAALLEAAMGADIAAATAVLVGAIAEATTAADVVAAAAAFVGAAVESAPGADTVSALWVAYAALTESSTATDATNLLGVLVGAAAESATGTDIETSWSSITRALVEVATGLGAEFATMAGLGAQAETAASGDSLSALSLLPVAETETVVGAESATGGLLSPQVVTESVTAADSKTIQLAAVGAQGESAAAADTRSAAMAAPGAQVEVGVAADIPVGAVTFNIVIAEYGVAAESSITTSIVAAAALEALTGLDLLSAAVSAAAQMVVATSAADWSGVATVTNSAVIESVAAVEQSDGEAGQWVGIYEVVSAVESGMISLTQLAHGLDNVSTVDLMLSSVSFNVGAVEYVVVVDIGTGFVWVIDRRFVVPGVGRTFAVKHGAMPTVTMQPKMFDVADAAPDATDVMASRNFEVSL